MTTMDRTRSSLLKSLLAETLTSNWIQQFLQLDSFIHHHQRHRRPSSITLVWKEENGFISRDIPSQTMTDLLFNFISYLLNFLFQLQNPFSFEQFSLFYTLETLSIKSFTLCCAWCTRKRRHSRRRVFFLICCFLCECFLNQVIAWRHSSSLNTWPTHTQTRDNILADQ